MLQAAVDTNVLIRANIKKTGSDYLIFKAFLEGKFRLLFSEKLMLELKRVLGYKRIFSKYNFDKESVSDFLEAIATLGTFVYNPTPVKICRDESDDEILSIALAVTGKNPTYIVSGDKDLLELKGRVRGVRIVTASDFLKILR